MTADRVGKTLTSSAPGYIDCRLIVRKHSCHQHLVTMTADLVENAFVISTWLQ